MIPITVCILAKNEEKNIEKCLKSIHRHPFEILVLDTGSTDSTKAIARKYTDRIYNIPWEDDFSKARNFACDNASTEWILMIDADEYIEKIDYRRIQYIIEKKPRAIGAATRLNISKSPEGVILKTPDYAERLFDRRLFSYQGCIHEQLINKKNDAFEVIKLPLTLVHAGIANSKEALDAQTDRNLQMMIQSVKKYPDQDASLYYHVGNYYYKQDDFEKAFEYYDQGLRRPIDPSNDYVPHMVLEYGYCLLNTGRTEQALALANVYDQFDDIADYLYLMGIIYLRAKLVDKALMEFLRATTMKRKFQDGTNTYLVYKEISEIYESYEMMEEAEKYRKKMEETMPKAEEDDENKDE